MGLMRVTAGVLLAVVGIWFGAAAVAWAVAGLDAVTVLAATGILLAALFVSVGLGLRARVRKATTYW